MSNQQSRSDPASCALQPLIADMGFAEPVFVTRPRLPRLSDYQAALERVWETGVLTNRGDFHRRLADALCRRLGVDHISLTSSGTSALMLALRSLGESGGEVITTPFTFPATVNALIWCGFRPVFCDIDPNQCCLDPSRIESLITPLTRGILPVHVFGHLCDMDAIESIAARHHLWVLTDAAHAFGAEVDGRSILQRGDLSILSFHATKPFSTVEGGAVVCPDAKIAEKIDRLGNFGIVDEETIEEVGINAKMSEIHAAYGLLMLEIIDEEIAERRRVDQAYRACLAGLEGIDPLPQQMGVTHGHAHFPVLVDGNRFPHDRDALCSLLRHFNVHARKYFHPLCTHHPAFAPLPSAAPDRLPVAECIADRVLCMPIFSSLGVEGARRICDIVRALRDHSP